MIASGLNPDFRVAHPEQPRPPRPVRPAQRQPGHRRRHDRRVRDPDHRHRPVHRPRQLRHRGDRARAARRPERPEREFGDPSLNTYITPASDRIAFVGRAVGNVVAHEAGHFFGDWHVDQFNDSANLMDQGGNFPLMFGVGPDGDRRHRRRRRRRLRRGHAQPQRGLRRDRGHAEPARLRRSRGELNIWGATSAPHLDPGGDRLGTATIPAQKPCGRILTR